MAMPATARRSEPHSSKLQSDLELHHHSPHRATQQPSSRASTPRPSISPLSTHSKLNRSPELTRDVLMAETAAQEDAEVDIAADAFTADVGELRDDRSSSLSEPEEEQDVAERDDGAIGEAEDGEPLDAQRSLDVDSEAETDRLDQTPQKSRPHADSIGKTPSKLSQAATAEDELSEPPSPIPTGAGAASSTSTVATTGQKRKRSDTAESSLTSAESDLEESPRKRSYELQKEPDAEEAEVSNGAGEAVVDTVDETPAPEEARGAPIAIALLKGAKGKKGKQKGRKAKEAVADAETDQPAQTVEPEAEPSEETAAKTEEEKQQKAEASTMFEDLAKQFTAFRDRLYTERLATMTAELDLLSQPDCRHPEYLRQVASVNARREKQMREAQAHYHYRLRSMQQRALGDRSQLHSQYFQRIRDLREQVLYGLGEDWYNIQKERRQQHQENDDAFVFKFPTKRSAQIRQQAKYNQEVSVLSGVAKYVGFPAAPDIGGTDGEGLEDDFKAMRIPKRVNQPTAQPQPVYQRLAAVSAQNERLAHEQFIEQNAWAQPQRPLHTHGTPNLTHTPDWAEHTVQHNGSARNLIRNLSGQQMHRTGSPYTTPMPQKRHAPPEHSSSGTVALGSDGAPEPPSSVLAAPPTSDRMNMMQHSSTAPSPLQVNKQRHQDGSAPERERTGFRNISNISGVSGASTIDAPPDSAEKERQDAAKTLPTLLSEMSAPQQVFDTSQMHRHGQEGNGNGKDVYANAGFRPQEGAFGTPAPLTNAAP